jgi:metal-dependent amidase/aminoacylase/carboxypeptidase family protein
MMEAGCDLEALTKLRKHLHMYPEGKFEEFKTQQTLIDTLKSFGIDDKFIRKCAGTGLVVDL